MALQDPVAVYVAKSNTEAQLICHILLQSGIEAFVIEDLSGVGLWIGGTNSAIHDPKIWVDRANVESALPILKEHDRLTAERRSAAATTNEEDGPSQVEAVCEECGGESSFPAAQRGTVQDCPHCGKFMDVGADDQGDDAWAAADDEPEETS
jgi:hypothetical protein